MNKYSKIYVAGHRGMVGSALVRKLTSDGYTNIITRTSAELDLTNQAKVLTFFESEKPEYVFLAAAKVGGIVANMTYPAEFIYNNVQIASNIIHSSYLTGVTKLLNMGSTCIYPSQSPQPMKEEYLMTGPLEQTNEWYAIAKIAAIKMCEAYRIQYGCNYISVMPTNLYGPNDNYDLTTSHVLPAMIAKIHRAKVNNEPTVTLWGSGSPYREFMHVDDLADCCVFLMNTYNDKQFVNVGVGKDITIKALANLIRDIAEI